MTQLGTVSFKAAFRSKKEISGTIFKGMQKSVHTSKRNPTGMASLSMSMGKALASLHDNVLGFGKSNHADYKAPRYAVEIERPQGTMVLEYCPEDHIFYHSCSANGKGVCYHIFELIALIMMKEDPQGELRSHFENLDFGHLLTDEKNFFTAADALYYDGKELYENTPIYAPDDAQKEAEIIEDFTSEMLNGKGSKFSLKNQTPQPTSIPTSTTPAPSVQIDFGRDFTDLEKSMIEANATDLGDKELPVHMRVFAKQLATGQVLSALFMGDAGTGKTTVARMLARDLNVPVYQQNYSANAEESDILGGFVPDEDNGGFKWIDGELVKAFRDGGFYIADEINFAKAAVLGALNNMLDGVGQIVLKNGQVVRRNPSFRFIAALNVGYAGTQRMNQALINRFNRVVKFENMTREKQIDIIIKESSYQNRAVVERMVDVAKTIQEKIKSEGIDGAAISIRNLINWANDVRFTNDILESAWSTVVWAVCYEDEDVQKEIFEDCIQPRFQGVRA